MTCVTGWSSPDSRARSTRVRIDFRLSGCASRGCEEGAELTLAGRCVVGAGFALPRDAGQRPALQPSSRFFSVGNVRGSAAFGRVDVGGPCSDRRCSGYAGFLSRKSFQARARRVFSPWLTSAVTTWRASEGSVMSGTPRSTAPAPDQVAVGPALGVEGDRNVHHQVHVTAVDEVEGADRGGKIEPGAQGALLGADARDFDGLDAVFPEHAAGAGGRIDLETQLFRHGPGGADEAVLPPRRPEREQDALLRPPEPGEVGGRFATLPHATGSTGR